MSTTTSGVHSNNASTVHGDGAFQLPLTTRSAAILVNNDWPDSGAGGVVDCHGLDHSHCGAGVLHGWRARETEQRKAIERQRERDR